MTDKASLHKTVEEVIKHRLSVLAHLIGETRESNNDTKSSMGDKYETGREMLQQEINHLESQYKKLNLQLQTHRRTDLGVHNSVKNGSSLITNLGNFYISCALGSIEHNTDNYYVISAESPLAKALWNKSSGDKVIFNGQEYRIESVS